MGLSQSNADTPAIPDAQRPTVALALGGGSARGLAHILMIEALEEAGVRPVAIAGTSIGAIMGACLASGMTAAEIRGHFAKLLAGKRALFRALRHHAGGGGRLWTPTRPTNLDPVVLLRRLLPQQVDCNFAELQIPLIVIAADFYAQSEVKLTSGAVIPAVAASAALPAFLKPVVIGDRVLIDGGFVNPTPFDAVLSLADITVAIDVTGAPLPQVGRQLPTPAEASLGATQILFRALVREKLARQAPRILIRPAVAHFGTLDFLKMDAILAAAIPAKVELRRRLAEAMAQFVR